jgi:hypothetical protein
VGCLQESMQVARANMVGGRGGPYLYCLMRDGDVGPRLGDMSLRFVCDKRTARGCWFRGLWGLRIFSLVSTGLRLVPSPTGAGANGGSAAPIRFRLQTDHGIVLGAELD